MRHPQTNPYDLALIYHQYASLAKESMDFIFTSSCFSTQDSCPYNKADFYGAIGAGDRVRVMQLLTAHFSYIISNLSQVSFRIHKMKIQTSIEMMVYFLQQNEVPDALTMYLSRHYFLALDELKTERDANLLHYLAIYDFTRIAELHHKMEAFSPATRYCISYLFQNDIKKITVDEIAAKLSMSARHLSSLFQKEVGETIHGFCHIMRIEYCKFFLTMTGFSTPRIATMFHYSSDRYFSKVFKEYTGYSPQAFRKQFYSDKATLA